MIQFLHKGEMIEVEPLKPPYHLSVGEAARAFFEEIVEPDFKIFEWGTGPGSLWFAQYAAEVISVENLSGWFEHMRTLRLPNQALLLVSGHKNTPGWRDALTRYVATIDAYPDDYFDLVFSDGWAESRALCPPRAMPKVKPGGWLVIDDATWSPAAKAAKIIAEAGWAQTRKSGVVPPSMAWDGQGRKSTTAFFQRPE